MAHENNTADDEKAERRGGEFASGVVDGAGGGRHACTGAARCGSGVAGAVGGRGDGGGVVVTVFASAVFTVSRCGA
jgi:hypothetical protein